MENNSIVLVGNIVGDLEINHETYGEKFYDTKIRVKRMSGDSDIIKILVSEKLLVDNKLEENTLVCVKGQVRSYNQYIEQTKKRKLIINVFVKEIEVLQNTEDVEEMTNDVELIGHLCKKPIYRKTPFGREISDILLAVNRPYGKSDYLPCIAWGRNARFSENLDVGQIVKISGRLQSRVYTKVDKDGNSEERVAYEISIQNLEIPKEDIDNIMNTNQTIYEQDKDQFKE